MGCSSQVSHEHVLGDKKFLETLLLLLLLLLIPLGMICSQQLETVSEYAVGGTQETPGISKPDRGESVTQRPHSLPAQPV